ncbi:MAG: hypothetical protein QXS41_01895 [Candidatus Woesearchaeota archaeon]
MKNFDYFLNHKKGQVVIYIFIGVIILLVILLFILTRGQLAQNKLENYEKTVISVDLEPIKVYVDSCLKKAVNDNLFVASIQGGYVETSQIFEYIDFLSFKVPYYYNYYSSKAPSFTYLKTKLEEKTASDIVECLLNLKKEHAVMMNFDEVNFDLENMRLTLFFTHDNVIANLKLKTEAKLKDGKLKKDTFEYSYKYQTNFYRFYLIAKQISEKVAQEKLFEKLTLEVIAANLPYKGYHFGYNLKFPKLSEAKEILFNALTVNFRYIVVPGFQYVDIRNSPIPEFRQYADYYHEIFKLDIADDKLKTQNVKISFMPIKNSINSKNFYTPAFFQDDDFYFSVSPTLGDSYKPINLKLGQGIKDYGYFPILPVYIFDYQYYVDYAILVSLENTNTNEIFYFGLRPKLSTDTFLKDKSEESSDKIESIKEIISSLDNLPSCTGNVSLYLFVEDEYTGDYANDVNVYYYCAGFACYLGKTQIQSDGKIYINAKVPRCLNPTFIADSKDFYFEEHQYNGEVVDGDIVTISGDKLYQVPVVFRLYYDPDNLERYRDFSLEELAQNESLLISIQNDVISKSYLFNNTVKEPKIHLNTLKKKYSLIVSWVATDKDGDSIIIGNYAGEFEAIGFVAEKIIIPIYIYDALIEAYKNNKLKEVIVES